jgi:hypothetical protein
MDTVEMCVPEKERDIQCSMNNLEKECAIIVDTFSGLEARLESILRTGPAPNAQSGEKLAIDKVALANRIDDRASTVRKVRDQMECLISRLEL